MAKMLGLALVLVSAAEAWLAFVLARVAGQPIDAGLAWALVPILLLANAAFLPVARRSLRSESTLVKEAARSWMITSIAFLLGGTLSVLAFAAIGAPVWGADVLAAGVGELAPMEAAVGAAFGGGLLGFGAIWWGYVVGQRWVRVEHVDLPIEKGSPELASIRIAHVTDLHIGPLLRAPRLARLVRRINATSPDLIVLTGDIFDFDPVYVEEGCRELGALRARLGVFAVLGNHDVYTGADTVAEGLTKAGLTVLRDEWTMVGEGEARFCLVGAEDPGVGWAKRDAELPALDRLAREAPSDRPRLLLIHRPSFFPQAARLGFPAMLSGHTHGGQLSPPFMREHNVSRMISRWTRGLYREGDTAMYVNPGLGVAGLPVRLNCPREIALIRLVGSGC
ncbi:MAG: metallophosphoesterase [Actinomycetota bacterium]|nr:metallophosphoesterase [Actinomycetota bacterium]